MFDIGGGELILIVLVILLLFGPKKIPEFAKMLRRGIIEMKKAQSQFQTHIDDISDEIKKPVDVVKERIESNLTLDQIHVIKDKSDINTDLKNEIGKPDDKL